MLTLTQQDTINILLVDDHPVVRMGYATLLKQTNSSFVIDEAGSRAEALERVMRHPDALLLDLTLDSTVELSLIHELRTRSPSTNILVVSMLDERFYAERVLKAGAKGYVMKSHAAHCITQALQTVLAGKVWLSENMRSVLMSRILNPGESEHWNRLASLSDRELEVLRLFGAGLKKAEVAARLGLSANTVETYRSHLKQKLGIATGAELYRFAFLHFQNHEGGAQVTV